MLGNTKKKDRLTPVGPTVVVAIFFAKANGPIIVVVVLWLLRQQFQLEFLTNIPDKSEPNKKQQHCMNFDICFSFE